MNSLVGGEMILFRGLGWAALAPFVVVAVGLWLVDLDRSGLAWLAGLGLASSLTWFLGNKLKVDGPQAHMLFFVPYRFTPALLVPVFGMLALVATADRSVRLEVVNVDLADAKGGFAVHHVSNTRMDDPPTTYTEVFTGAWPEGAVKAIDLALFRGEGVCFDTALEATVGSARQFLALKDTSQRPCYSYHELRGVKVVQLAFKQRGDSLRLSTKITR